jgi:phosphoglycerol transferase MdoB-like AlkP superfamily enzyme
MMIVGELAHIKAKAYYRTVHILLVTLYTIAFFACTVDVPFFSYFFTRLNAVAANEIDSFGIIANMILSEPTYLLGLLAFIALAVGYILLMRWVFRRLFYVNGKKNNSQFSTVRQSSAEGKTQDLPSAETKNRLGEILNSQFLPTGWAIALALVLVFATFVGMRGRLSKKSPIRVGTAYFCGNAFLNQLGLNPVFTFVKSIEEMNKSANKPLELVSPQEALQEYLADCSVLPDSALAADTIALPEGTNVVLVIMESMMVNKTGLLRPESSRTPCLDSLMRRGLVFTQCYSAGIHTYNGIYSTLYSHPGILARHTMKHTFIPSMCGLPHQLQANGYQTTYMMTHDEDYDNMRGFLHANGFDSVIGQHSFPADESVGTWGLPDHRLFEHAIEHCTQVSQHGPFLTTIMTCSDHVPYILPDGIPFTPRSKAMADKMTEYADWSIGHFMQLAAQQPWFDNTIFVFIADHGAASPTPYDIALSYHHVPMLFYCPQHIAPRRCDHLALQIDLFPTLMGMLPYTYHNNTFGIDLLRNRRQYAYFSSDDKISILDTAHLYVCQVAENIEHLFHYCDTTPGDQIALHRDKADAMRRRAFGLIQHSYNMLENHTTACY